MNWDNKAHAETLKAMHLLGADAAEPVGVRVAAWQREALLTDEAVERAAEAVHHARGLDDYGAANDDERDEAESIARAALTAAIEGEQ